MAAQCNHWHANVSRDVKAASALEVRIWKHCSSCIEFTNTVLKPALFQMGGAYARVISKAAARQKPFAWPLKRWGNICRKTASVEQGAVHLGPRTLRCSQAACSPNAAPGSRHLRDLPIARSKRFGARRQRKAGWGMQHTLPLLGRSVEKMTPESSAQIATCPYCPPS